MGYFYHGALPWATRTPAQSSGVSSLHRWVIQKAISPSESTHRAPAQTSAGHHLTTTYPRVLPASLPRVSEPERNHGESLVLPGLDVLPAPELLFNFDLGKKQKVQQSQNSPKLARHKPGTPGLTTLQVTVLKHQPRSSPTASPRMCPSCQRASLTAYSLLAIQHSLLVQSVCMA